MATLVYFTESTESHVKCVIIVGGIGRMFSSPSLYAHVINGVLLLTAFIILYSNWSSIKNSPPWALVLLALAFSIAFGIHGLSHLGLERQYNYNPLA